MRKITWLCFPVLLGLMNVVDAADTKKHEVIMSAPVKVSKSLHELAKPLPQLSKQRKFKLTASGDFVPGQGNDREIPNKFLDKDLSKNLFSLKKDKSLQSQHFNKSIARKAPEMGVSFDGIGNVTGSVPPDTNGDVGPNHYVQMVNVALAVWDKQGNQLLAPTAISDLWNGFGGLCETNDNGDPIVLYDSQADRWLISQFAFAPGFTDNHQCIAISQTGDPTGAYFLYDFLYDDVKFNDYPHFGVWTDGYYMGVNQFLPDDSFAGGGVVAYERDAMLAGAPAQQVKFDMDGANPGVFTPMPLDLDGTLLPPADSNQYFIWADRFETLDKLQLWEFAVDWDNPQDASFTQVTEIPVTRYGFATGVTQPNGTVLDAISPRSMFRAAYRNLEGQGKIVFTHNVAAPAGQGETALRWYEINVDQTANSATLVNEGTFAPDQESRWMGSGAMDANGNMAFGYSIASSNMAPSIAAATRLASDPINTLTDEFIIQTGEGSQSGTNRWGDYSSMSVDPVDDCTFWYTTEYYKAGDDNSTAWSTRVASFKIASCVAGPRGQISGTVTDSSNGEVIPFATVSIGLLSTKTDADGRYIITMPVGETEISASKYGWVSADTTQVNVQEDQTVNLDISLSPAAAVLVSGTVKDGGGTDNPLYARINVAVPGDTLTTFSNPETGTYSIQLFAGTTVNLTANEIGVGGYLSGQQDLLPTTADVSNGLSGVDFALATNSNCSAPGYDFILPSFFEGFDSFPANGWTISDEDGGGVVWGSFLDSGRIISGVEGEAAFIDSDAAGFINVDSSLISPSINVADLASLTLQFDALFRTFNGTDLFEVDIDIDRTGWTNIATINPSNSIDTYTVDLSSQLNGATSFQLRFHYFKAFFEYYALVDNISFGARVCSPIVAGNLVTGYVNDANTGEAVNGANITLDGKVAAVASSTTQNTELNDGWFQMFVADTTTRIEVEKDQYQVTEVAASDISLATPINLSAGQIAVVANAVDSTVTAGRQDTEVLTLTNTGSADAKYNIFLVEGNSQAQIDGPFHPSIRHFGPKNMNDKDTRKTRYFPQHHIPRKAPGDVVNSFITGITYGWGVSISRESGEFYIGDVAVGGAPEDKIFEYDSDGKQTGDTISLNLGGEWFAGSAFNQRTGMLWQVNVGGDNCIHEIDTQALAVTGNTICPEFGVSQRGLAYDPITNTFYSGSWTDSIIHQFTTDGTLIRSVNVDLAIAGLAFNANSNRLFVSVNTDAAADLPDIVVLDAASETLAQVTGYDVIFDADDDGEIDDVISDFGQAGLDIDCDGNLWIAEQNLQRVIGIESQEESVCEWGNVPWLAISSASGELTINASNELSVSLDSADLELGTYQASIVLSNDTPYGNINIPVTMDVVEPQFGSTEFQVTAIDVAEGENATLLVERMNGSDFEVSVSFATVDGTAVAGTDYTATSGTLTWTDLDSEAKTIEIPTLQLDVHKSFNVTLSEPQGGAILGEKASVQVNVKDQPKGSGSFGVWLLGLLMLTTFGIRLRY